MIVIGLDPGTEKSALVAWNGQKVTFTNEANNVDILCILESNREQYPEEAWLLVIEKVESFGMAVGVEVFETVFWAGRFAQIWNARSPFYRLARREIKTHLCHSARATDANIRQALIDRFGGQEKAIGKKANPGPLHSLKGHLWSAFAVAITYWDQNNGTA